MVDGRSEVRMFCSLFKVCTVVRGLLRALPVSCSLVSTVKGSAGVIE